MERIDESIQIFAISTTQRKLLTILQDHEILPITAGFEAANPIHVYDEATVDSEKFVGLKPGFDVFDGLAEQVDVRAAMDFEMVVRRLNPVDLVNPEK